MTGVPRYADVVVGLRLPARVVQVQRLDTMVFCGASLDFATPHWNERAARSVGLPDVIAHRSLTVAKALALVTEWTGDPLAVVEFNARLVRPVVVPDDGIGAVLHLSGVVGELSTDRRVGVDLLVAGPTGDVLATVRALVQLT